MSEVKCANCKYWKPEYQHDYTEGICRRMPPTAHIRKDCTAWPETTGLDWCGEFVAKEK